MEASSQKCIIIRCSCPIRARFQSASGTFNGDSIKLPRLKRSSKYYLVDGSTFFINELECALVIKPQLNRIMDGQFA